MTAHENQGDDCLCHFLPFLRAFIPSSRKAITHDTGCDWDDPREISSSSVVSGITAGHDDYDKTNMNFSSADYRGFVFAIHPDHGTLLLHCTRKKKKPHHFQLPGGHIDAFEFEAAAKATNNPMEQLMLAGRMGTARELFEETGMDLRNSLNRLQPSRLYSKVKNDKLMNEYKSRLFYTVNLTDDDFLNGASMSVSEAAFLQKAMGAQPPNLKLKLSQEHQGFAFEKDSDAVATLLQHHSGGKISSAVRMTTALQANQIM